MGYRPIRLFSCRFCVQLIPPTGNIDLLDLAGGEQRQGHDHLIDFFMCGVRLYSSFIGFCMRSFGVLRLRRFIRGLGDTVHALAQCDHSAIHGRRFGPADAGLPNDEAQHSRNAHTRARRKDREGQLPSFSFLI